MDIGVVIPIYNTEAYLPRCLDSVCAQGDCVKEIVLVNDGSTDGSLEICKEYAIKDARIKIIDKENAGAEQAVIDGVNAVSCGYVGFVDSDDHIEPDMFDVMAQAIDRSAADICICNYDVVDNDGKVLNECGLGMSKGVYDKKDGSYDINILPTISNERFVSAFRWNKLFKRSLLVNNIAYKRNDIKVGEDFALVLPVIMSAERLVCVTERLYHYVNRGGSLSRVYDESLFRDSLKLISVLESAVKHYGYRLQNFNDSALAVIMNHVVSKVAHSGMGYKFKKRAYKEISRNEKVRQMFDDVKIKTSFKRALKFGLLKHRLCGLLALVY